MSSQSSVYTEKKIAAYESLFKESNFAKPQEVYLTITVAHVFGQAYILEQEGTKEGDPVYSRFVCPLEEITKVYVNDKIKKPWPLFIQCDTNVKGVIHRKRIVIPCLNDPTAIAEQINEVKALHMEKYEAAIERENQRKRAELESARMKEQTENEAKSKIPPLPSVEKLPEPVPAASAAPTPSPVPEAKKNAPVPPAAEKPAPAPKSIKSAKALTNELEDSFKALESIDSAKSDIKPLPKKPVFDFDDFDQAFNVKPQAAPKADKPAEDSAPKAAKKPDIVDLDNIEEAIAAMPMAAKKAEKPVSAPSPAPAAETAPEPVAENIREAVIEAVPEPVAAAEPEPVPVVEAAPAPAPKPVMVNPVGKAAELSEFESAVIILKAKKDSGEITAEQYAAEKKRLISTLY